MSFALVVGQAVGRIVYRQVVAVGMVLYDLSDRAYLWDRGHGYRVGLVHLSDLAYLCLVGLGSLALCRDNRAHACLVDLGYLYREGLDRQVFDRSSYHIDGLVPYCLGRGHCRNLCPSHPGPDRFVLPSDVGKLPALLLLLLRPLLWGQEETLWKQAQASQALPLQALLCSLVALDSWSSTKNQILTWVLWVLLKVPSFCPLWNPRLLHADLWMGERGCHQHPQMQSRQVLATRQRAVGVALQWLGGRLECPTLASTTNWRTG